MQRFGVRFGVKPRGFCAHDCDKHYKWILYRHEYGTEVSDEVLNAFSVDLEDWFCVANMEKVFPRDSWESIPLRVESSSRLLLEILESAGVKATFFVLGWIAERCPELIERIYEAGHEIAVHGYAHARIAALDPTDFEADLDRALDAVSRIVPRSAIRGYRAPSFSIMEKTSWALDVLASRGLRYDSSIFPAAGHPDYGWAEVSPEIHRLSNGLLEFPMTPGVGGGYFRLLPYFLTRRLIRRANNDGRPAVFYVHPWELDVEQPRVKLPATKRFRHYVNLRRTSARLRRLLSDFKFTTLSEVLDRYERKK